MKKKKVLVIGGGTGTYTVLSGLKKYPLALSVIVSMTDSGGSNRVIRDEFGLLPTSDIRQCMVALTSPKSHEVLRELFTYRYNQGVGISGMSFGNLFMAALTDIYGSQEKAIKKTCEILDVDGEIIPVTFDNVHLIAKYTNGRQILGEHFIDEPDTKQGKHRIETLEVIPKARVNPKALRAIKSADCIVLGPGDLYTSLICNLIIEGVADAIRKSKAKKVFVVNLMTKFGQTNGFGARDHLRILEKYLGDGTLDYCMVSKNGSFPKNILKRYKQEESELVVDDFKDSVKGPKIVRGNFFSKKIHLKVKGDVLDRSLIRHDPDKLARAIVAILK
ncbi:YvcK family protein [Candidatus Woesebacteria bacterium]|nr:YvcK family protein [Candidatus Woesebacteria bacterium]